MPSIDAESRLLEDDLAEKPGPMRYAIPVEVSITPESHGNWQTLRNGGRLWRLRFHGPGATDLNFGFTRFRLPPGASLHLVSEEVEGYFEGPYTYLDNEDHGQLWSPMVPGERAFLELYLPPVWKRERELELELTHVGTGYRDLHGIREEPASRQGSCNNDVICPEGDPWRNQIRSVGVYSINGSFACTGQLVADVPGSFRPFFLTANHCGLNSGNDASVVVYWNYESPVCGQLSGGSLSDNQTGSTFRASRSDVDVALIELDDDPDPSSDVYFSGWDRSGVAAVGSVGIHHPGTDEKAISFNDDLLTSDASCIGGPGTPDTHWWVDDWEDGTTEPGSSGSGLWDPATQRLVGFLSGGTASCASLTHDCYGKFSVAWDGASSASRLKDWLDPADTGAMTVDGSDPAPTVRYSSHTGTDTCAENMANENGSWEPGEVIDLQVDLLSSDFFSNVQGTLTSSTPGVTILDGTATWPDLISGVPTTSNPDHFQIGLASTAICFDSISFSLSVSATEGGPFPLLFNQTVGDPLAPMVPVPIPDNGGAGNPGTSDLVVSQSSVLTDVDVRAAIDHTYVGDLKLSLRSPMGTEVVLLDRPGEPASTFGCSNNNMDVTFDDASGFDPESHCAGTDPWYSGVASPVGALSDFNGQSTAGTWTLIVSDNAGADTGSITDWELLTDPPVSGSCAVCGCSAPETVVLTNVAPENGTVDETACQTIEVGPYQLGPLGTMSLTAGSEVIFKEETVLEGDVTVVVNPSLAL